MNIENDDIIFESSGRILSANGGIIGISPAGFVFGGYDHELHNADKLNSVERAELAEFMIFQWRDFAIGNRSE